MLTKRVMVFVLFCFVYLIPTVDGRAVTAHPIYDDPHPVVGKLPPSNNHQHAAKSASVLSSESGTEHKSGGQQSKTAAVKVKITPKNAIRRRFPSLKPKWTRHGMQMRPLLSDFVHVRDLGRGSYGSVELAELPHHPELQYAIKTVTRRKIVNGVEDREWGAKHAELLHNEVRALKSFTSPFTVQMFFLYSSHTKHFFVEEFVESGDLKTLLLSKPKHRFDELADVRFYMTELLEGLAHMHGKGWIYRDLKTDNTLIARDGHLKLADYGFAKQTRRPGAHHDKSSASVLGTPQNMAPEIDFHKKRHEYTAKHPRLTRRDAAYGKHSAGKRLPRSYHQEVDYFALGCVFFEMLLGRKPFTTPSKTSLAARRLIHRGNVCELSPKITDWPTYQIPQQLPPLERSLMRGLLSYDPAKRLGHLGPNQVKEHPYFIRHPQLGAVDWNRVRRREYPAPYIYENGLYKHTTGKTKESFPRVHRRP